MITGFADKTTKTVYNGRFTPHLPHSIQRTAYRKLLMLNAAATLQDLRTPPSNHLEKLKGDRAGQYSIRINDTWRICFTYQDGNATDVQIANYH